MHTETRISRHTHTNTHLSSCIRSLLLFVRVNLTKGQAHAYNNPWRIIISLLIFFFFLSFVSPLSLPLYLPLSSQVRTQTQTQTSPWRRSVVSPFLPLRVRTTSASVDASRGASNAPITASVCSLSRPTMVPKVGHHFSSYQNIILTFPPFCFSRHFFLKLKASNDQVLGERQGAPV